MAVLQINCLHGLVLAVTIVLLSSKVHAQQDLGQSLPGDSGVLSSTANTRGILPSGIFSNDDLNDKSVHDALRRLRPDSGLSRRGAKETQLYAKLSSAVVLVITTKGFGSGAILSESGQIITNWHVVAGFSEVGVVFKPKVEGRKFADADLVRARVEKVDEIADLALLMPVTVPKPLIVIPLADAVEIAVGADVHAIGHPTGEAWTYTKGIVSQIRRGYQWNTDTGIRHQADVIQTQTPINPGNSGGPLLSDLGRLVGVNSFKAEGEALNFAVSVDEVRRFISAPTSRVVSRPKETKAGTCIPKIVADGPDAKEAAYIMRIDRNCSGKVNAVIVNPDDKTKPIRLLIDSKDNGKIDTVVLDTNRDGKWDISFHDVDGDGKPDLVGHHPDGSIKPSRYTPYTGG